MTLAANPIERFVRHQGVMVLDGGIATTLESLGHDLDDPLWSARVLLDAPEEIARVHTEFLEAGTDCIATSTYQATLPGFRNRGLDQDESVALLRFSVGLAIDARDAFWKTHGHRSPRRLRPIVAASVGPYGAFLADGSEYTGNYGLDEDALYDFHRERWAVLAASGNDLLACETIPSAPEARVLLRLLDETPGQWAWISFSCRDDGHLSDGTPLVDAARECDAVAGVAGVGVNCVSPDLIASLVSAIREGTGKPVVVYANSGERYNPAGKTWHSERTESSWLASSLECVALGVASIGGCCRIGPDDIRALRSQLAASSA